MGDELSDSTRLVKCESHRDQAESMQREPRHR